MIVDRGYETMKPKERVQQAINHGKPDRVPINYMTNEIIDGKLKESLGLKKSDNEGLLRMLGVDFRGMYAPYTGKPLHTSASKDRRVDPLYGWVTRYIENDSGGYWDYCDFPLSNAGEEEVAKWPFPNADDYDYDALLDEAKKNKDYALYIGDPGLGCIINTIGFLRGMEQTLIDLISDEPAGLLLIDKLMRSHLSKFERDLEKVGHLIDLVWIGEDLGTQHTPLISKAILHKHILPWHKKFIDIASSYNIPVMMHTCGSSSWAYEDYIKAGLKGVETLQPEATNMQAEYLKTTYGNRLFFHGCISTAGPLAYGTTKEVESDTKSILKTMMPGAGYIFSPTHQIQDNTPVENIIKMYNTAHTHGRY